ncbi:MAG: zinc transport system ATP-binding protein [Myxococcota bacterium]|jgi:zinc transport system ATP-binding protein
MPSEKAETTPVLTLDRLQPGYMGKPILPPCSVVLGRAEVWALVGRNGSGKSSLMRTLVGTQPAVAGTFTWAPGVKVSWVPQRDAVDTAVPMRVVDVVQSGLDRGWSLLRPRLRADQRRNVTDMIALTELEPLAKQQFSTLSEGQKQRALMARALVSNPDVLLLDEPTSAMDPMNESATLKFVDQMRRTRGVTVVLASHHAQVIPSFAEGAIFLDREDQVALAGPVAEVIASAPFLARYGDVDCFHTEGH